jgi:formate hydrogenlyase subunit 3/multisubunit Na+/H+ antiporter MnhD subunit
MLLAFFGFGVKAGALPVHFWLPLAHPVAPVPASAVLSGAMIKAGLLGWLYFLPIGGEANFSWGMFCIAAGMLAALGAVLVGMTQQDPKTMLAYSSISQMGVMTVVLGIGLSGSSAGMAVLPVILVYALNHALAKGALFFGAGMAKATGREGHAKWWVAGGLAASALAIAGAPWTGGSIAKYAIKDLAVGMPEPVAVSLAWLLPLTSVATSLLLGRVLWLVWKEMGANPGGRAHPLMWASWGLLIAGVIAAVALAMRYYAIEIAASPVTASRVWTDAWPIGLALGLLFAAGRFLPSVGSRTAIPAGDIVVLLERGINFLRLAWVRLSLPGPSRWAIDLTAPLDRLAGTGRGSDFNNRIEERLRHRSLPGVLFLLLALALVALIHFGTPVK